MGSTGFTPKGNHSPVGKKDVERAEVGTIEAHDSSIVDLSFISNSDDEVVFHQNDGVRRRTPSVHDDGVGLQVVGTDPGVLSETSHPETTQEMMLGAEMPLNE